MRSAFSSVIIFRGEQETLKYDFESRTKLDQTKLNGFVIPGWQKLPNKRKYFTTQITEKYCTAMCTRVAEVARTRGQCPAKSLDSDEIFQPKRYFVAMLRSVAIFAFYARQVPFVQI